MTIYSTQFSNNLLFTAFFLSLMLLSSGCSDSNNNNSNQNNENSPPGVPGADNDSVIAVPAATIEGPIEGTPVVISTLFSLVPFGYERVEYFVSGTANSYVNVNELQVDGKWQVEASGEQAEYKTRIVVIRPIEAADHNGTVVVEWMNASAGFDSDPGWGYLHNELMRNGYIWLGVSAQKVGIDALQNGRVAELLGGKLNDRYESLFHPGDSFSYDIFSQIAQALREPGDVSALGNLKAQRLIALGQSQSAGRLMTYVNALAPLHALYDGYFIHSRTGASAGLQGTLINPTIPVPEYLHIRDDLGTPTLMLQTESDLFLILDSYPSRQDDGPNFRLWEIAGTAHADLYQYLPARLDAGGDPSVAAIVENDKPVPGIIECELPVNSGPQPFVANAAIRALHTWIVEGTPPPRADRLEVAGDPPAYVKDEFGNTIGGIRTPHVDVPIALLEGLGQPQPDFDNLDPDAFEDINIENTDFCFLSGTTKLFDAARLRSLYDSNEAYIEALNISTDEAVSKGFLIPEDAALIKANAASSDIFAP